MTSAEIIAQIKEYILAGNKNPQVIDSLLNSFSNAVKEENKSESSEETEGEK